VGLLLRQLEQRRRPDLAAAADDPFRTWQRLWSLPLHRPARRIVSAVKPYSLFDHLVTTWAFVGHSLPAFFTGLLFILLFSLHLG